MDLIYFLATLVVPGATLYITFKYGKLQDRQYTRDSLFRLFSETNQITSIDNIDPLHENNIKREFKRIYNQEVSLRTIHILTAGKDDYKFAIQCFRYSKKIIEVDNYVSNEQRRRRSRICTGFWVILIFIYYALFLLTEISISDGISIFSNEAIIYISASIIKNIMFLGAIPLSIFLGLSLRDMQFFNQIVLRERYINTPIVSTTIRNRILQKIDSY